MKRKIAILMTVLFILGGLGLAYMYFVPKDYVIPYTLTKLYGEDLEERFPIGRYEVDGEVYWEGCQRDADKNLVISMTEMQRIHSIHKLQTIFDDCKAYVEDDGYHAEYNDEYTAIYYSGKEEDITEYWSEEDIHYELVFFYAYQIFRGQEDNMVTVTVADEDGTMLLEKHFTNFPKDVELYELPVPNDSYMKVIENTGSYEAINVNYEGNIEIIATPEQFEQLPKEVKDACK